MSPDFPLPLSPLLGRAFKAVPGRKPTAHVSLYIQPSRPRRLQVQNRVPGSPAGHHTRFSVLQLSSSAQEGQTAEAWGWQLSESPALTFDPSTNALPCSDSPYTPPPPLSPLHSLPPVTEHDSASPKISTSRRRPKLSAQMLPHAVTFGCQVSQASGKKKKESDRSGSGGSVRASSDYARDAARLSVRLGREGLMTDKADDAVIHLDQPYVAASPPPPATRGAGQQEQRQICDKGRAW
ncbi:hypothetical protein CDD83_9046 [Cordyceps sp. RAO-2017]|nr:hypothetical protein CDD83_9046 [Cordyceps sp. RAO-2017]